jgi:SH3-like domain-containing protein
VEKGQRFQALEKSGKWFQLLVGSRPGGWAHESIFRGSDETGAGGGRADAEPRPEEADSEKGFSPPVGGKQRVVGVEVGLARTSPLPDAPVRFRLYGSEAVSVLEERGEWLRIQRINGWIGWAHESIFRPEDSQPVVLAGDMQQTAGRTATVSVDVGLVREAPFPEAPRAFRVVKRMKVQVLDERGDWLKVRMNNGWVGWAHNSLFKEP